MPVCPGRCTHTTAWEQATHTLGSPPPPPSVSPGGARAPPGGFRPRSSPPWTSWAPDRGGWKVSTCSGMLNTKSADVSSFFLALSLSPGQEGGLSEASAAACQPASIHGTLPRRKKGAAHAHGNYTWDPRANQTSRFHQAPTSPLAQDNSDEFHAYR